MTEVIYLLTISYAGYVINSVVGGKILMFISGVFRSASAAKTDTKKQK